MKQNPESDLEKIIHEELRRLPNLPAPPDLASRVMRQLERRQALPWWRQSLWHWPAPARVTAIAFFASCAILPMLAGFFFLSGWSDAFHRWTADPSTSSTWIGQGIAQATVFAQQMQALSANPWFLSAVLVVVVAYLTLIGAGSAFVRLGLARQGSH